VNPLPLKYHPHADYEIDEAFEWYRLKKHGPTSASRLLDELETAFERIAAEPDRWPKYLGARRFTLRHFPYLSGLGFADPPGGGCPCPPPSRLLAMATQVALIGLSESRLEN
jgi:plasmid stabilization system protein ParE